MPVSVCLTLERVLESVVFPDTPAPLKCRPLRTPEADEKCMWQRKNCVGSAVLAAKLRGTRLRIYLCAPCHQEYSSALAARRRDLEAQP